MSPTDDESNPQRPQSPQSEPSKLINPQSVPSTLTTTDLGPWPRRNDPRRGKPSFEIHISENELEPAVLGRGPQFRRAFFHGEKVQRRNATVVYVQTRSSFPLLSTIPNLPKSLLAALLIELEPYILETKFVSIARKEEESSHIVTKTIKGRKRARDEDSIQLMDPDDDVVQSMKIRRLDPEHYSYWDPFGRCLHWGTVAQGGRVLDRNILCWGGQYPGPDTVPQGDQVLGMNAPGRGGHYLGSDAVAQGDRGLDMNTLSGGSVSWFQYSFTGRPRIATDYVPIRDTFDSNDPESVLRSRL
ncbi:hypothetical protein NHQ30_006769 [Ciborinia camelliae]|nr:hypothetical protein NHQ30_006769 [Ciborinia camelliae]